MKRIVLKNVNNTRDLGGYYTKFNREIKYDAIIRSNVIQVLEENEVDYFIKRNIKTIIDFREKDELEKKINYFSKDGRFKYYNIPLRGREIPKYEKNIASGYITILDDKVNISRVLRIILESSNGVIFNCNSGKDRTGVISMIILLICGVSDDDIIADYSVSDIYLKKELEEFHKNNPKLPKFVGGSKSDYMKKTLELFYEKYKSIENYMYYLGFNDNDIVRFRNKLINDKEIFWFICVKEHFFVTAIYH